MEDGGLTGEENINNSWPLLHVIELKVILPGSWSGIATCDSCKRGHELLTFSWAWATCLQYELGRPVSLRGSVSTISLVVKLVLVLTSLELP